MSKHMHDQGTAAIGVVDSLKKGPETMRVITKRIGHKNDTPTPLAFVIAASTGKHASYSVTVARWSEAALGFLQQLDSVFKGYRPKVSLPVASLRSHLELEDEAILRMDRRLGRYDVAHEILWTESEEVQACETSNNAVNRWLVNEVACLIRSDEAATALEQLKQLARKNRAITTATRKATPFWWETTQTRTTKPHEKTGYADLADAVARRLAGRVVFPGLSGLRRIAGGELLANQAELITEPLIFGANERFSLVVRIHIFSYPGRTDPVIAIEFSRRVWTTRIKLRTSGRTTRGYAFPKDSNRAFQFTLENARQTDGKFRFELGDDFGPLKRYFSHKVDADWIFREGHRDQNCKVFVVLKHGIGERSNAKSGVPDVDKMDGFCGIQTALAEIGLVPWTGLKLIETSTRPPEDSNQHWRKRDSDDGKIQQVYAEWLREVEENIVACYVGEHNVVLGVQPGYDVEDDAVIAEDYLTKITQGLVNIERIPIPPDVHGPRDKLPGRDITKPQDRAQLRVEAWQPFIDVVKHYKISTGRSIDGVMILAHEWYEGSDGTIHDDMINKRAARLALATGLGVPVQYLCPQKEENGTKAKKTQDFRDRTVIAWLDLAYKSMGRLRPGKLLDEARKVYGGDEPSLFGTYPDRVMALGIIRRNQHRFISNERSFLPFAIELDVATGNCTANFVYEDATTGRATHLGWLPLPQALVALARLGPVQLYTDPKNAGRELRQREIEGRTQAFFKECIADTAKRGLNPLVIIDADSSRSAWRWLADERIDPANVELAGGFNAQSAWPALRLVRVRTQNSPKVLWGNRYEGTVTGTGELVTYNGPRWANAELFEIADTVRTKVYLSFGSDIRTNRVAGHSCYRTTPGMNRRIIDGKKVWVADEMDRFRNSWTTPTGVEIFVVRAGRDHPDQIARMVEWLRQCYPHYGGWSTKPAPLFFESVLKQYLADYEFGESEEEGEEEME